LTFFNHDYLQKQKLCDPSLASLILTSAEKTGNAKNIYKGRSGVPTQASFCWGGFRRVPHPSFPCLDGDFPDALKKFEAG
jgi:hypothetical protein